MYVCPQAKLVSRKKKAGFDDEIFSETSYYIRNGKPWDSHYNITIILTGLRYVKPYYFTFTTHAKGRWVGFTVYDIFCREFQAESPEYYVGYHYILTSSCHATSHMPCCSLHVTSHVSHMSMSYATCYISHAIGCRMFTGAGHWSQESER